MAYKKIDDVESYALFGKKLFMLGEKQGLIGPPGIAEGLYQNDECFKLIHQGKKHSDTYEKDISTISRRVQDHFRAENAWEVKKPAYLRAYSILFNCSMDYLFGRIEDDCPTIETYWISKKTGLSVKAVEKIMSNQEVCMEEWLITADRMGLLDIPPYNGVDPDEDKANDQESEDDEDQFIDTYASVTKFWSDLIESKLFTLLPEYWHHMACAQYTHKGTNLILADLNKPYDKDTPDREEFTAWLNFYHRLYPEADFNYTEEIGALPWISDDQVYKKYLPLICMLNHDIREELISRLSAQADNLETAHWGLASKLERSLSDYFEKKSADWIRSGPLPPYKD